MIIRNLHDVTEVYLIYIVNTMCKVYEEKSVCTRESLKNSDLIATFVQNVCSLQNYETSTRKDSNCSFVYAGKC